MKKFLLTLSIILFGTSCLAKYENTVESFHNTTSSNKTTVAKAIKMNDKSFVTLQGNIEKQLDDDKYLFGDGTGTVTIEIDKDKWLGQNVTPKDKIEITGEIEKNFNYIKLDVYSVKKLNK